MGYNLQLVKLERGLSHLEDEEVLTHFARVKDYCISEDRELTLHGVIMAIDVKGLHLLNIGAEEYHFVHEDLVY